MKYLFRDSKVAELLELTEKEYNESLATLINFKNGDISDDIITFQYTLANAIFRIEKIILFYRQKKKLYQKSIGNKNMNAEWAKIQITKIDACIKVFDEILHIGKTIGDFFVLFFYRNSLDLLLKHEKEQVVTGSHGIGKIGEIEFIKNIRMFNGELVLYNEITHLLRIGDFSLYDFNKNEITGLCEMKTKQISKNKIKIVANIISKNKNIKSEMKTIFKDKDNDDLSDHIEEKLKRQNIKMAKSLTSPSKKSKDLLIDMKKNKLNEDESMISIEDGLLLLRVDRNISFRENYIRRNLKEKVNYDFESLAEKVKSGLVLDGSEYNSLLLSPFGYKEDNTPYYMSGFYGLFWEDLPQKFLEDLYLKKGLYLSIFNPAFFIDKLQNIGLDVEMKENHIKARYKMGKSTLFLENIYYFINLHTQYLLSLDSTIELINQSIQKIESMKIKGKARVDLKVVNSNLFDF